MPHIVIRKYEKNGSSSVIEFDSKLKALLWLNDHLHESEWCWVMYEKTKGEKNES